MVINAKNGLILTIAGFLLLSALGYFAYYILGSADFYKDTYMEKRKELAILQERKKQSKILAEELAVLSRDSEKVKSAFLGIGFDNTVNFTIGVEGIAKSLGVSHDISIVKDATSVRPSAKDDLPPDRVLETFPHMVFRINLGGRYSDISKFVERLNAMPYFINIERLDISRDRAVKAEPDSEREAAFLVKAVVQIKVFTHEAENSE